MVKDDHPPLYDTRDLDLKIQIQPAHDENLIDPPVIQICNFLLALGITWGITEVFHMKDQQTDKHILEYA